MPVRSPDRSREKPPSTAARRRGSTSRDCERLRCSWWSPSTPGCAPRRLRRRRRVLRDLRVRHHEHAPTRMGGRQDGSGSEPSTSVGSSVSPRHSHSWSPSPRSCPLSFCRPSAHSRPSPRRASVRCSSSRTRSSPETRAATSTPPLRPTPCSTPGPFRSRSSSTSRSPRSSPWAGSWPGNPGAADTRRALQLVSSRPFRSRSLSSARPAPSSPARPGSSGSTAH